MSALQDAVMLADELAPITVADIELEIAFDLELRHCVEGRTYAERRAAFERAQDLHKQRRPHMVARFEMERGLKR